MQKLHIALVSVLLSLVGCSQIQPEPVHLQAQRVDYCNFAGGPFKNSFGDIVAGGSADCRFVRDGRDSAQANSFLQKRRPDGTYQTISTSSTQKYTLPDRVDVAWHLFDELRAGGACEPGIYRTRVVVRWPLGVPAENQLLEYWNSVSRQYGC